jgi:hypothetical protein
MNFTRKFMAPGRNRTDLTVISSILWSALAAMLTAAMAAATTMLTTLATLRWIFHAIHKLGQRGFLIIV